MATSDWSSARSSAASEHAVTIITGSRVAPREDEDVSDILTEVMNEEGVDIVIGRPTRIGPGQGGIEVDLGDGQSIAGSHLLVATGRRSNSDLLGPDHGIQTDERGFFIIDSRFQTSVKGVWALGDVNGHGAFTHTAYQDGQILLDPPRTVDGRVPIYALYTDPPLGRVGMTFSEARASGRNVLKAEVPMSSVSRAMLEGETVGLMRILVDGDTRGVSRRDDPRPARRRPHTDHRDGDAGGGPLSGCPRRPAHPPDHGGVHPLGALSLKPLD